MKFAAFILIVRLSFTHSAVLCTLNNPFPNYRVLDETELQYYSLTNQPCTPACESGYFGEFCNSISQTQPATQGPWNAAGYYVDSSSSQTIAIDTTNVAQAQYSGKNDGTIVGLLYPTYNAARLLSISLFTKAATTILSPHTATGSIDAFKISGSGEIFVARSADDSGPFEVAVYTGNNAASRRMLITEKARLMEIFLDKGMNATFVYTTSFKIMACYPNGQCSTWASSAPGVTGIACGWGCPQSIFYTTGTSVRKLASSGLSALLISEAASIYCLASVPGLNALLYLTGTEVKQISVYGTSSLSYAPYTAIITNTQAQTCSLDISDSLSQIMLVQASTIYTKTAMQQQCPYKQTTVAVSATSQNQCSACKDPPSNAYILLDSPLCNWDCSAGYTKIGSLCVVSAIPTPCPAYFTVSSSAVTCVPSVLPWAQGGNYLQSVQDTSIQSLNPVTFAPYYQSADSGYNYLSAGGNLYFSQTLSYGSNIFSLQDRQITSSSCSYNLVSRDDYLIQATQGLIWLAFIVRGSYPTKHCLWLINPSRATLQASIPQFWELPGSLCSVDSGDNSMVYAILCGSNYVLQANYTAGSAFTVLAGSFQPGFQDGSAAAALFSAPSSLVCISRRVYVADSQNCLIREIDVERGMVYTASGNQGVCIRSDSDDSGKSAALVLPRGLTRTPFDGFVLFLDKYSFEIYDALRQFHTYYHTVKTLKTLTKIFTALLVQPTGKIVVAFQEQYYEIAAVELKCNPGYISLPGSALTAGQCLACQNGKFASGSTCVDCTVTACSLPNQAPVACTTAKDSYCANCINKPSTRPAVYIKAGTYSNDNSSDCEWAYAAPCPVGYYLNASLTYCLACPLWSTTLAEGSTSLSQCSCLGGGSFNPQGTCVVPSPYSPGFAALPSGLNILSTCSYTVIEGPLTICPCQSGEFISQIYPKVCSACPDNLHSPDGVYCRACPELQEPSLDKSACRCTSGLRDISLTTTTVQCACEAGKQFKAGTCSPCDANSIDSSSVIMTTASQSKTCTPCAPGTVSAPNSSICLPCALGWYRESSMPACSVCPTSGQYATDPRFSSTCQACSVTCNGRKETLCPNSNSLYICSDCPAPRPNSAFNGARDCATKCNAGYYDQNSNCLPCTVYSASDCPTASGFKVVPCSAYADSECSACVNDTKPLYYSQWGPGCTWSCVQGYIASKVASSGTLECVKEGTWSLWNLFTL